VRHCHFTGGQDPSARLKKALRADIDEGAWASLHRTEPRRFPKPDSGKISVNVTNDYGDKVVKVLPVRPRMTEFESLSRGWDHLGNIQRTLGDLQGARTAIHELIQNADDAPGASCMRFCVRADRLEVWNDGAFERCSDVTSPECEWLGPRGHRCDFHSFRKMASGDKRNRPGTTGAFGVGFTAVYQFTDRPELLSNGEYWIIEEMAPEDQRIKRSVDPAVAEGTTFRLPWALDRSPFREAVRQEPITAAFISTFMDELVATVPGAMPFLKKLRSIELRDSNQSRTFIRSMTPSRVTISGDGGERFEWVLLDGDFEEEAERLKSAHPGVIEGARSPRVSVAVPMGRGEASRLLYATLPTEEPSHLPVLINADFVPASDRKRIRFDDSPVSEWNRHAVRTGARLIAHNLVQVADAIGDSRFVALVTAARDLARQSESERIEPAFDEFWAQIEKTIPGARVVPAERGLRATPDAVRLWADEAEIDAVDLLQELGVRLIERDVRAAWYGLRGDVAGLRNLSLGDLAMALRERGLTTQWTQAGASGRLRDDRGLELLWGLIDFLLSVNDRWNQDSRQALLDCAVAPGWDGAIWPLREVVRADQATQDLFADLEVDAVFLDEGRLDDPGGRIASLATEATEGQALEWVERVFAGSETKISPEDRYRLLSWFFDRRKNLEDDELRRLAYLPIFPTAGGPQALVGLALPGDFTDELGLTQLVDVEAVPEMGPFLTKLGAKTLDFGSYCINFVPDAITRGDLAEETRLRLVGLLARKLSEVQDNRAVRDALRPLPLVPCRDRHWRAGDEVYLDDEVRAIVGDNINVAAIPSINPAAHQNLFAWLGAASEPRPGDIEARCQQLRSGAAHHRSIAGAIVSHVGQRYAADREAVIAQFGRLREIPWLPAEGDTAVRGHLPSSLFTAFSKGLFASQARFVDLPLGVQRDNSEFLKWLGVADQPSPRQVVDHLLWSVQKDQPVGEGTWIYLNQHADDPALDALEGRRCLLISDTGAYVEPSEVYWGAHPFGRFRHQLGPRFADYRALLERLQVRQHPEPADAVDVLLDVAAHHGGEQAPLLAEDALVVNACWRLLSDGLESAELAPTQLHDLACAEVVLNGRGWLSKPTSVFFRDAPSLAERFGPEVQRHLIGRPDGQWRALAAAGVGDLSDAVETRILEEQEAMSGGIVADRLTARRQSILRVLAADDVDAAEKLTEFEANICLVRLTRLVIDQALDLAGSVHRTQRFDRGALYRPDVGTFSYVETSHPASWVEVARELTRAIKVDGSRAPDVAAALRGVLAAETDEEARRDLDELGFRALDEASAAEAEPSVASGFGSTPSPNYEEQGAATSEGKDADSKLDDESTAGSVEPGSEGPDEHSAERAGDTRANGRAGNPPEGARYDTATSANGTAIPNGTDGSDAAGASAKGGTADSSSRRDPSAASTQTRLRSYVTPKGASGQSSRKGADEDEEVERAGVAAVMEYERAHGREPEEMPPLNPGFDVQSVDEDERVRLIEVKATAAVWGERGVAMSSMQFDIALKKREDFWLYVVDRALSDPSVHPINDPASKVDQYFFDDGWSAVAEIEQVERPPFEPVELFPAAAAPTGAVPFFEADNDSTGNPTAANGWVVWNGLPGRLDAFAVRIAGYGLGLSFYGGAALVEPLDGEPEDDELVCVVLHNQLDPDSRSSRSLRRWTPERDLNGKRLGLRLTTDGSVEPLTVTEPDDLVLLGVVRAKASPSDLRAPEDR
jgi:hypothetical protein